MNTHTFIHADGEELTADIVTLSTGATALRFWNRYHNVATVLVTTAQLEHMKAVIEARLQDEALAFENDVLREEVPA